MPDQTHDPMNHTQSKLSEAVFPAQPVGKPGEADHQEVSVANRLVTFAENWTSASSELASAIQCHPQTTQVRKGGPASEAHSTTSNPVAERNDPPQEACKRHINAARTSLAPYKKFFLEYLMTQDFYEQLRSSTSLDSSEIPDEREVLNNLFNKVIRLCQWETSDLRTAPTAKPQVPPLEELRETVEALETLRRIINLPAEPEPPYEYVPLPRFKNRQSATERQSDQHTSGDGK